MKSVFFFIIFSLFAKAEEDPVKLVGQILDLKKVTQVLVFDGRDELGIHPPRRLKTNFSKGKGLEKFLKLMATPKANGEIPLVFSPFFAALVLLDAEEDVVSIISVQTSSYYYVARQGIRNEKGFYLPDYDSKQAEFHSPELSRYLYEALSVKDPGYLREMRDFFSEKMPSLEDMILGKNVVPNDVQSEALLLKVSEDEILVRFTNKNDRSVEVFLLEGVLQRKDGDEWESLKQRSKDLGHVLNPDVKTTAIVAPHETVILKFNLQIRYELKEWQPGDTLKFNFAHQHLDPEDPKKEKRRPLWMVATHSLLIK